jgi:hypothetical protein
VEEMEAKNRPGPTLHEIRDQNGRSPRFLTLYEACLLGCLAEVEMLLNEGAEVDFLDEKVGSDSFSLCLSASLLASFTLDMN